jgi:hypothetical protein
LFGVKNGVWGEMPPPQLAKLPILPRNQKIVDAFDKTPGVFKHLSQALAEAVSGDIILVKHGPDSQEVEVTPTTISTGIDVVIKPYEGHRPILVLNKNVKEAEPSFFRLLDGSLRLENLQFLLEPAHAKFNGQSVVQIGENASCTFNQCVATLKAAQRVPLQFVRLVDADELMRMDAAERPPARVEILNSFVRGEGTLLEMRGCRPLDATIGNSVVVLAGSLLHTVGGAKEVPSTKGAQLHLSRVSAYLTEPVLSLSTGRASQKALARTVVDKADHCLFVALAPEQPFSLLDTLEPLPQMRYDRFLAWKEGNKNGYVNFLSMLEHRQSEVGPASPGLDRPAWIDATKDMDARHEAATFRGLQGDASRSLWKTTPDQLKPNDNEDAFAGLGATLEVDLLLRPPTLTPGEL